MIKVDIDNSKKYKFNFDIDILSKKISREIFRNEKLAYDFSFNVKIVNDTEIKKINYFERKINKVTDVLSFPNVDFTKPSNFSKFINKNGIDVSIIDLDLKTIFLGDIIICYNMIIKASKKYGHSIKREYSFLLTHSILHLLGYDHMNEMDEKNMFSKQEKILNNLKIFR